MHIASDTASGTQGVLVSYIFSLHGPLAGVRIYEVGLRLFRL